MRLKRLELFGFKSFADRTVLDFEGSLSGIVGPNGCGKSNVVDAVRWVLGETRPTSMRGDEMADVVFKGSTSRPAMSVAEATMVLDNASGLLEERGAEVSITRRVYKSGEGEYLIDGERVRRKDVREMLLDTGLGSRGYAVLEQGRIDAVLSANALDRRAIFEEAAGISRYRQRKKEAESRLGRVQQDLVRLDDVVGELERRERSLKIQAGKARRFLEARDAWREEGARLARHRLHELEGRLDALRAELAALEEREREGRERRAAADEDVAAREREQEALAAEVERAAARAAELGGDLRALDERASQLSSRVAAWERAAEEERGRADGLDARLAERRAELERTAEEAARAEEHARDAAARAAEEERERRELERRYGEARAEARRLQDVVLERLHERTSGRNAVTHLERQLEPLAERARRAEERRAEATRSLDEARTTCADADEAVAAARLAVQAGEGRREAFQRQEDALGQEAARLDAERGELELERARVASRVESLLDREHEREGLDRGARTLLQARESNEGPELACELVGLVADHLRTGSEAARALDAALGARAQALVLSDPADAGRVVAWLKEHEAGQVPLALPAALHAPTGDPMGAPMAAAGVERVALGEHDPLLARDGVLGRLVDRVEAAPGFERLARALVGDVVLVRDVALGLALVRERQELRFASLEGDLVDAAGLVGGHRALAQGPVGRRSHAAELGAEIERADARIAALGAELEELAARRARTRGELDALFEELERARAELAQSGAAADAARRRARDLEEAEGLFRRECETLEREREGSLAELAAARERLERVEADFERDNAAFEAAEASRRDLEAGREERARAEAAARVEATRREGELESARRRLADLERGCAELAEELARTRRVAEEHRGAAVAGRAEAEELGERRTSLLAERGALEEALASLREREQAGRAAIEALRRRREEASRELEALLGTLGERRLALQKLELRIEDVVTRAGEDFDLDAAALREGFEPEPEVAADGALDELGARVAELRTQLDKLGPVNLEAVGELDEVAERLGFLTTQRDDLVASRKSLEGTLRTIDAESERLFVAAFEEIRGHFRATFRKLFGGGRADLELAADQPVLEAGIEIQARPPGRETLPISLLSGGQRTMTALALLFAIFRSRPSPFCVLDEVDAALDDANIGRFLGLLDDFRTDTQFVLVTHNKGSMAACDLLYGVTMAVKGVSRVVSVELADVDAFVPEATGNAAAARAPRRALAEEDADEDEPNDHEPADDLAAAAEADPLREAEAGPREAAAPSREDDVAARGPDDPPSEGEAAEPEDEADLPGAAVVELRPHRAPAPEVAEDAGEPEEAGYVRHRA